MVDAVFFVPHQDDEALTQGPYIRIHVEAGRDIRVVMTNTGENVAARERIEQKLGVQLSVAACSKARDREALDFLNRIGVPPDKVLFENFENDGPYTLGDVKIMMRRHFSRWGSSAAYKTHSWMDEHRDHHLLGRALEELNRDGLVPGSDVRYCRSWRYGTAPLPSGAGFQSPNVAQSTWRGHWDAAYEFVDLDRFTFANNPISGPRYGIGGESTTAQEVEDSGIGQKRSMVHGPSSNYTSSGRTNANNWLSARGFEPFL